jgi:hypothetical protein
LSGFEKKKKKGKKWLKKQEYKAKPCKLLDVGEKQG